MGIFRSIKLLLEVRKAMKNSVQEFMQQQSESLELTTEALAALDEKDWEIIDELVDRLKRKSAEEREKEQEDSGLLLQAAHKRTDIEIPEGVDTSDDEYFD